MKRKIIIVAIVFAVNVSAVIWYRYTYSMEAYIALWTIVFFEGFIIFGPMGWLAPFYFLYLKIFRKK